MTPPPSTRPGRAVRTAGFPVLAAVALGGAAGAAARHAAALWRPGAPDHFPWTTLGVNVLGCALIGVLMVAVTEARTVHPLVRPFLGTGFLGGFTTFSTYAVGGVQLLESGRAGPALALLAGTPVVALAAVWTATAATRRALRVPRPGLRSVPGTAGPSGSGASS
ncbi:fluoride efflux transporter FluC [Streptomyces sp. enrichment culture]|uniref:fluoride efflux transporter FluC n=1 Tax=Streptomyces sp. enrichment culture TaxID=1795815 RepID=UPI003F55C447